MESRRAALFAVALVVVSGCAGNVTTSSGAVSTTERPATDATARRGLAPVGESPGASAGANPSASATTRAGGANASLPPGVNASGLQDPAALVAAHRRALENASFAFRFRANVSVGPASQWTVQRGVVEPGLSPLVVRSDSKRRLADGASRVATDMWADGTTVVVRYSRDNRTRLRRYNRTGGNLADETWAHLPRADLDSQVTQSWLLELALVAGEYDLVGTERRDGRRLAILRATDPIAAANYTDFAATVRVDAAGRVHSLSLTAAYAGDAENRIHYEFELTAVGGVAVERPAWVEAAIPGNETAGNATTTVRPETATTADGSETTTAE